MGHTCNAPYRATQVPNVESCRMTLDVSGGEFVTAFNRMMFCAQELLGARDVLKSDDPARAAAQHILCVMSACQREGLPVGARILDILRAACVAP